MFLRDFHRPIGRAGIDQDDFIEPRLGTFQAIAQHPFLILGPAPINGLVTTQEYAKTNQDTLLKLIKVWFRIVNYIQKNPDQGGQTIVELLNKNSGANFTVADFKKFWQHYEHYPLSAAEAQQEILDPKGRNYWKNRWDDCNRYFFGISKAIAQPVEPKGVFLMPQAQAAYIRKYGNAPMK